jgi:hypothetical protein
MAWHHPCIQGPWRRAPWIGSLIGAQEQLIELTHFLRIAIGLATALGQVDRHGLTHKDIKPANERAGDGLRSLLRAVPGNGGAPGEDGERASAVAQARSFACGTRGTAHDHPRGRADHSTDLGA